MKRVALITGASSGIGKAIAEKLAPDFSLILCGRRAERLDELKKKLATQTDVVTLTFDVANKKDVAEQLTSLSKKFSRLDILVNNAGNAHGLGPFQEGDPHDWDAMIDSNLRGVFYVTHAILPLLLKSKHAHIINLGSIAGKAAYPNGNVYCATKAAIDTWTDALRMDLNAQGVKVTAIHPGLVETEFSLVRFKGDAERAKKTYQGLQPLVANDIADLVHYIVQCPPHVVIADVVVLPLAQASAQVIQRKN